VARKEEVAECGEICALRGATVFTRHMQSCTE
jgi:hypothetical protein